MHYMEIFRVTSKQNIIQALELVYPWLSVSKCRIEFLRDSKRILFSLNSVLLACSHSA